MTRAFLVGMMLWCVGACAHTPVVTLPLEGVADGQIVVPAIVNGQPMKFLLDTGSAATLITPRAQEQLGLYTDGAVAQAVGAGGGLDVARPVELDDVYIGGRHYRIAAYVAPFDRRALDPTLAGVLGQDFLALHDVEIDFAHGTLRLLPPGAAPADAGDARLRFDDDAGLMRISGQLDGQAIAAVLDLGATATVVNRRAAPGVTTVRKVTAIGADGNPIEVASHRFDVLLLGDAAFVKPTLYVGDLPIFGGLGLADGAAALVGLDLLAGRRLVIDYRDHEIRIGHGS